MKALTPAVAAMLLATTLAASATNWADAGPPYAADPEYARSMAICRSLRTVSFPPAATPGGSAGRSLRGCRSESLYYGIGMPSDPARARQCAVRERTATGSRAAFAGDVMLMTIYANGVGAPRDLDHAIAIACELDGAPAEQDGRINHLATLKAEHWAGHDFSFCDDITSGFAQGVCAAHGAALADAARRQQVAALTASWSDAGKRAFLALQRAEAAYAEAHGGNEVDLSGTARAAMAIDEEQSQKDKFLGLLQRLEQGDALPFTAQQSDGADARLNAAYQRIQHAADSASWGTVTKDSVRTAQRAWLRYRDAWLAFARVRYPAVDPASLRAALTEPRTAVLETFLQ